MIRRIYMMLALGMAGLVLASRAGASESGDHHVAPAAHSATAPAEEHAEAGHAESGHASALAPENASWAGVMVLIIAGMFLSAAAVGIAVRANSPVEESDAGDDSHGHDSHGPDHGHAPSEHPH